LPVAFKCLTSPLDLPINEGQFRALDIAAAGPGGRAQACGDAHVVTYP
jgi:hypothetical protein